MIIARGVVRTAHVLFQVELGTTKLRARTDCGRTQIGTVDNILN